MKPCVETAGRAYRLTRNNSAGQLIEHMKTAPLARKTPFRLASTPIVISETVVRYPQGAHQKWKDAQAPWQKSLELAKCTGRGVPNYSVWGQYAGLVKAGRFWIPSKPGHAAYKFVEYHAALLLERQGYRCWGGVQLFDYDLMRKGKGPARENTEEVRKLSAGLWPWPSDIQHQLAFRPKNPDIVAYHPTHKDWRFLEVKSATDRCHRDQVKALAVLRLLTGSAAEIVRVLPEGRTRGVHNYEALVDYVAGARLTWLRREARHPRPVF